MASTPKLVVADAGPLIGLARIGKLDLLHKLFRQVLIPSAVASELRMGSGLPGAKVLAAASKKGWLKTVSVSDVPDSLLLAVDRGEAESIMLAKRKGSLLLIDERCGRTAATRLGVSVFGTGAVLIRAKECGHISAVGPHLDALQEANYRISSLLRKKILQIADEADKK
jgi:predicted nucleic acid-binding protein